MTDDHQVLVTYAAPPAFLASASWKQIQYSLLDQLPLRNIHWKSVAHSSLKTIQELSFTLVQLESVRDELASQIPATLLEKPLLNIYVVTCDDMDIEAYRHVHKRQIKDWLNIVTARKHQEWLLLHLVKPDARAPGGKLFQLKGSVLEKMKGDFNTDKRDRCLQLTWAPGSEGNAATWGELLNKIKDGIVHAFDCAISQREEEVKRSESQRQMPGWNFCTFFILKESLSNSFEGMNLFEEALQHYNELEQLFAHVLKEKNLSWFGSLITPEPTDDSSALLSMRRKPYRDLILANSISVFDLRIYLLARRCELLSKLCRITEAAREIFTFLLDFSKQLRLVETSLPKFFIESWIYSSALNAVEQCDEWSSTYKLEESPTCFAAKGELLELAQNQLNVIGVRVNHLPPVAPFKPNSARQDIQSKSQDQISNTDIQQAIENKEFFFDLYIRITNRAIEMYAKAKRRKFALRLHESLAALDVHRGHFTSALGTYSSLPAHYAPHMWSSLESFSLSRALDIHDGLQKEKNVEWIHILLAFLKTFVECPETDFLLHKGDRLEYISRLVSTLNGVASELETAHPDHPAISIKTTNEARLAETMDGYYLDATIYNRLPCTVPIDGISAYASGRDPEAITFSANVCEVVPGKSTVTLFCPAARSGTYILDSCHINLARLKLYWSCKNKVCKVGRHVQSKTTLIYVPADTLALDVQLREPDRIRVGSSPSLLVNVSTGRNDISEITLRLSATGVHFQYSDATTVEGLLLISFTMVIQIFRMILVGEAPPQVIDGGVTYSNLQSNTLTVLKLPYTENSAFHVLKVLVDLSYTTTSEPDTVRSLHTTRVVNTSLPISVNVQDYFREKSLFSKFTVSTATHQHVRIASVRLEAPESASDLKITSASISCGLMTVRPSQPLHFLFRLDSDNGSVREPLVLVVQFRMLREEVEDIIANTVVNVLKEAESVPGNHDSVNMIDQLIAALEKDANWVELYELTGELIVPGGNNKEEDKALQKVKKVLATRKHPSEPEGSWREMRIPVDIPQMEIIASTCISLKTDPDKPGLYAGQPVPACVSIHTSFHWGSNQDEDPQYRLRFDVEESIKDWLISGRKRGDFVAKDGETQEIPLTLIALHHGELALPKVVVTALPVTTETSMGRQIIPSTDTNQVHGAQKVLVLPRGGKTTFVVGMGAG
ncbi:hypothetical protein AMATHDRAFT_74243 [Amanita thiersii Skay4041]|uniref:Trafficking protein particle complex subunit 10 n=1 Tax=Amanita thiersii Skay4041 TaxID=703135 RepID=A0A2A9NXG4_9AGAR|nr:hypothetical protein AMATHDRAFT_74243 [Amanita thiersii Skay4041]